MRAHPTEVGELVKHNEADFLFYKDQELWYRIAPDKPLEHDCPSCSHDIPEKDYIFDFPVPTKDLVGTMVEANVKAITLMKWVGKHLKTLKEYERLAAEAKASL